MDALLRALQLGFIMRSLFAGVFFVIAYRAARIGFTPLFTPTADGIFTTGLPVAVFVGVGAYVMHRALVYPVIEHLFNTPCASRLRQRFPLISKCSIEVLQSLWFVGAEQGKEGEAVVRHITVWADYTHMLYVSASCVVYGSVARSLTDTQNYGLSCPLLTLTLVLVTGGLVSNWRLHVIRENIWPNIPKCGAAL